MWRTVFVNNRFQQQQRSSTSSSMDLLSEKSLNYSLENHMKLNCDNEQQCKIKNSNSFRMKNRKQFEKQFDKQQLLKNQQQKQQQLEQDLLTLKSTLIESKKKLTKKFNIKFRQQQQTTTNDKIKRRIYEQFECAVILNDCMKMALLLKENSKLNLAEIMRPDGHTFLHTAIRYQCKDALSWLVSRCNRSLLNQQNSYGESPLHLAVREQSPILVNILLNHKACNHVQNYLNKETPLHLALNLYIKYRNMKDYDYVPNSISTNSSTRNGPTQISTSTQQHQYNNNGIIAEQHLNSAIKINSNTSSVRSFDQLQLDGNSINTTTAIGKLSLQATTEQDGKENDANLNRLISQPTQGTRNSFIKNSTRNHLNNKLDDLTAAFLNKQNLNCCSISSSSNSLQQQYSPHNRSDIETINNCRLMRKIVMAILHDSDPNSWKIKNSKNQNAFQIAKEHQVDFVCDYQKVSTIIRPTDQIYQIDQNGNYLSTTFDTIFSNQAHELQVQNQPNNLFNIGYLSSSASIAQSAEQPVQVNLNSSNDDKTKAISSAVYNYLDFETKVKKAASSLSSSSSQSNSFEAARVLVNSTTSTKTETSSGYSSQVRASEKSFPSLSTYANKTECNGNKTAVNHYKRKTDDDEQQHCLKEQRSIIKQDNFKLSTIRIGATNSINNRLYFRKSNRSHSITLGSNIKLLDRDHHLFTSSCSLNRLSELESRNFNNLDHHLESFDKLIEEQQLKFNHHHLDSCSDQFQKLAEEEQQQINEHFNEFSSSLTTFENNSTTSSRFTKQHQQHQSIQCSKTDSINKQQHTKTALAVYQ